MERKQGGYTALALMVIAFWGSSFAFTKQLITVLTPTEIMFIRFAIAYVSMWVVYPKTHRPQSAKAEGKLVLLGILGGSLYFWTENTALAYTQASNVSLVVTTAPILTAVLAHWFTGDERFHARLFAGFLVAMAGVFLVIFNGQFTLQLNFTGDLLAIAAALSWALYTILLKHESTRYNGVFLTRKVFFYAMLTMAPLMATKQFSFAHLALLGRMEVLLPLLFLGLVCSTACYVCWNRVVAHLGAVRANNFVYLNPLVAMVVSVLFLHETITVYMLIGAALILGGVFISEKRPRKPRAAAPLPPVPSHLQERN